MTKETDLERAYDLLADAIDRIPPEQAELFLTKLALLLGERIGSAEVFRQLVEAAERDL